MSCERPEPGAPTMRYLDLADVKARVLGYEIAHPHLTSLTMPNRPMAGRLHRFANRLRLARAWWYSSHSRGV